MSETHVQRAEREWALATMEMKIGVSMESEFLRIVRGVLGPTRAMRGCTSCNLYRNTEELGSYILCSRWQSYEDLIRYIATREVSSVLLAMDLLEARPEVRFETMSNCFGLELAARVPKDNQQLLLSGLEK